MKTIQHTLLALGLGLVACAKEDVSPKQAAVALQNTSWRMTAYTIEARPLKGTGSRVFDFFKSYSSNASVPCLGLNTLTFTSGGEVLWTQEAGGCAVVTSTTPQGAANINWGNWRLNDRKTQLTIDSKYAAPGSSILPVMYAASGAYDVNQANTSGLILSSQHIIGRHQDSILVERAVFKPL